MLQLPQFNAFVTHRLRHTQLTSKRTLNRRLRAHSRNRTHRPNKEILKQQIRTHTLLTPVSAEIWDLIRARIGGAFEG